MSVINQNLLLTPEGYQISRSVRLRSSASAYFNRTLASSGSLRAWTWSAWVKRGALSSNQNLFGWIDTASGNFQHAIYFVSDNTLEFQMYNSALGGYVNRKNTAQVFRDTSAWYHIVVVWDSNNATAEDRARIYVNGSRVTVWANNTNPALNQDSYINNSSYPLGLGRAVPSSVAYFDGYLTEVNFIDGQALTPSSFGETDAVTGVWKPKKYAGTYGTNGFYLNFSDNSAATAAAIGKDSSGNGNNWTPNNISVTAGASYDSMLDVPTMWADGGNGRGNYCTFNPLVAGWSASLSNYASANLAVYGGGTQRAIGTQQIPSTGKWYFEFQDISYGTSGSVSCGVIASANDPSTTVACMYQSDGTKYVNGSATAYGATYGSPSSNTDVIGVAVDNDAGTVTFYKNNTSQGAITHGIGNVLYSSCTKAGVNAGVVYANFGQRPFAYTPPTGFKALNTQNLPDSTIKKGNQFFDVSTWTGDQAARTITNSGAFQPDLIWTKSRSDAESHRLHDAVRGGNGSVLYELNSNLTEAEGTDTLVSGFASNGFTIASGANTPNITGRTYVGWQWKESVTAGFDIVTYTGTGANTTVAHSLGVAPKMLIVKSRNGTGKSWNVWHTAFAATDYLYLEQTAAKATDATKWNSTAPSSTVFSLGSAGGTNASGENFVAHLFAEVAGFSKFGSYTGNGSADGPFVYLGFRPRWVMIKPTVGTGSWQILDTARDTYNVEGNLLWANESTAETSSPPRIDVLSNGFKARAGAGSAPNVSGEVYIYAAFAENPFKNSLAR